MAAEMRRHTLKIHSLQIDAVSDNAGATGVLSRHRFVNHTADLVSYIIFGPPPELLFWS